MTCTGLADSQASTGLERNIRTQPIFILLYSDFILLHLGPYFILSYTTSAAITSGEVQAQHKTLASQNTLTISQ